MRIPMYGELFRHYKTETKYLFTIRNMIPYEGMLVQGMCSCYHHAVMHFGEDKPKFTADRTRRLLTWGAHGSVWKVLAQLDENLIPICPYCKNPMPEECLIGFKQVSKTVTQTRCKHKGCAGESFRYRIDPVPNTRNWKGGYSAKRSGLLQAVKEADRYPKFTRGRRSVKALQDALWRETHTPYGKKSWKDCTRKKYQWMKKFNKSKWSIEKQDRLWEEYLFNNDNYLGPRYITKLEYLMR